MAFQISRLYDFQPGTKILSSQVDAEFNQLITSHNNLDAATDTYKALLLSSTGSTNIGITPVAGLDVSVNTLQKFILAEVTARLAHTDNISNPHGVTKAQVGLSNADNTSDLNKPVSTAQLAALNAKVDKVTGKGLSTEDYTTTEKTKLAGIATGANNYTHPATHSADIVVDGTTNKAYTALEKTKLAGIAAGANNYTHPATHSADIVVDGTTNKAYTATEKTKLAGIAANVSVDLAAHTSDKIAHIPRVAASGTANTYAATIDGVTEYTDDLMFWVTIPANNTGAATINVNGLGAKEIYTPGASSLASGTLLATQNFLMHYRSNWSAFALLSRSANDVDTRANQYILNKTFNSSNILDLTEKTTPIDADGIALIDSIDSKKIKRLPWSNLKSTIKTYFDALYAAISHTHAQSDITNLTTDLAGKAEASSVVTATLAAASWVGSAAPYTQTVTVSGMTATKNGLIGLSPTATATEREAARNAILSITAQGTDTITITADGTKPTVDVPVAITLLG